MSFVRVPRRSQSLSGRTKRTKKKKPTWDSTTSDLTVHKLSKDELDRRHKVHQSTNLDVIKEEKRRKALLKAKKERSLSEGSQTGLLREILYDEKQLNDALTHSDRVMSVVKDLFYDDPKRLKAVPHITRAPGGDAERRRAGPIVERGPHTSYLDVLSDSVMDPSALNEYQEGEESSEEEGTSDDDDEGETPVFDSRVDVERFQSYIQKAAAQTHETRKSMEEVKHQNNKENMDPMDTPVRSPLSAKQQPAINNTAKVKKKMKSRTKAKSQSSLLDVTQKTKPEDLQMYLNELMAACSAFDRTTGVEESRDTTHSFSAGFPQLSGYTAFLVQTLTKILKHLNESEARLALERESRSKLEQEMAQQRQIIDAMTVDMMQSQELNMKIQAEARKHINQMEQRLQIVEHLLSNRDFALDKLTQPISENGKEPDVTGGEPSLRQDAVSNTMSAVSTSALIHSNNSCATIQSKTVPQTSLSSAVPMASSALDSVPGTSVEQKISSSINGHTISTGETGYKASMSQAKSNAVIPSSEGGTRNSSKSTGATVQPVGNNQQVPQLSQHTMEKLMASRTGAGKVGAHFTDNMRSIQTNIPSGIQGGGFGQSSTSLRPADEGSSAYGFGLSSDLSTSLQKGNDSIMQGISAANPGAFSGFGLSSELSTHLQKGNAALSQGINPSASRTLSGLGSREPDVYGTSSTGQHLQPIIQPAMLLSPPKQKDRRDFIRPPGYESQQQAGKMYGSARGGTTSSSISSNLARGIKISSHQPQAVPLGRRTQFSGDHSHSMKISNPASQSRHPPPQPLLSNYTSDLDMQKERAPSVASMDSSSTRYLSLPGDHRQSNIIKNILYLSAADNVPHHGHAERVGPTGQDHRGQPQPARTGQSSRSDQPVAMETLHETPLDGAAVEHVDDTSIDMNEKIAALSRQRVEAQARLEQLKGVYASDGKGNAPQRPTTRGGEATDQLLSSNHPGVLIGDSPPVSPIAKEPPAQRPIPAGTSHSKSEGRTIHVSMPKLSDLEMSATSTPASKRTSIGSGGPSPNINQSEWKTPLKSSPGNEQFFALKAHIST